MLSSIAYLIIFVAALIFSFRVTSPRWRVASRFTAIALASPLGIIGLLLAGLYAYFAATAPPTLSQLAKAFPSKQHDLQTILAMSDQDARFRRIDPGFVDEMAPDGSFKGRFMAGDPKAGLRKPRWDEYRSIFERNYIDQGIERDGAHDAFIRFGAEGLLNRGHGTGIVFCAESLAPPATDVFRYEPCTSTESSGSGKKTEDPRREAFSFQKLAGRWYAYDQGPS